jgi:hypothetical protein
MMVHAGQLLSSNENCKKFDDVDVDMLNGVYSVSAAMLTSQQEEEPIKIYKIACIGYIAGYIR